MIYTHFFVVVIKQLSAASITRFIAFLRPDYLEGKKIGNGTKLNWTKWKHRRPHDTNAMQCKSISNSIQSVNSVSVYLFARFASLWHPITLVVAIRFRIKNNQKQSKHKLKATYTEMRTHYSIFNNNDQR